MNILAPHSWIKEFIKTDLVADEFARRTSLSGPAVERINHLGRGFEKIVVGQVLKIQKHPNADKLKVAVVDVGKEELEIVCGGSNLAEGMKVAVARVGAKVRWHGAGEPVELAATEIRGVKSFGMICAANEIGLFDFFPHAEREILDLSWLDAKPGANVAAALGLEDAVFDIEVTTNRVDAFSMVGLAREASAILGVRLIVEEKRKKSGGKAEEKGGGVTVTVRNPKLCPRYQAAVIEGVAVGQSPWWLRRRLIECGLRPINNVVDATNYVMLELGQPLHAFDAEKLEGGSIVVRTAEKGERIRALDGKDYELSSEMLVIADTKRPLAIAGVIGGEESGVTAKTKRIVLESATFDPMSVRRTTRALGIQTDASLRFDKGLSTEATVEAIVRAIGIIIQIAGGRQIGPIADVRSEHHRKRSVSFRHQAASEQIGVSIPATRQKKILESLGFGVSGAGASWRVAVPWWRNRDIEAGERDLVEEVARIYGYHNLPSVLPEGAIPLRNRSADIEWENDMKALLSGAGLAEVYTYSFVSEKLIRAAAKPEVSPLRLQNPLTSDFEFMRIALVPSLLEVVKNNPEADGAIEIFEISRVYPPKKGGLPDEPLHCGVVLAGQSPNGELFYRAKGIIESIFHHFGIRADIVDSSGQDSETSWLHPGRRTSIQVAGKEIGFLGEIHPKTLADLGIEQRVATLEFDIAQAMAAARPRVIHDIPAYPSANRDISFVVGRKIRHAEIHKAIRSADPLIVEASLFDTFAGKGIPAGKKSVSYHLVFRSLEKTLSSEEVDASMKKVESILKKSFDAEIRT